MVSLVETAPSLAWPPPHHPSLPIAFLVTLPIILCCLHSYNTWSWNPTSLAYFWGHLASQCQAGFSVLAQGSAHGLFIHSGYRERCHRKRHLTVTQAACELQNAIGEPSTEDGGKSLPNLGVRVGVQKEGTRKEK